MAIPRVPTSYLNIRLGELFILFFCCYQTAFRHAAH